MILGSMHYEKLCMSRSFNFSPGSGAEKDPPVVTGLALDGNRVFIVAGGRLRIWDPETRVALNGGGVVIPKLERLRLDKRGILWGVVSAVKEKLTSIPVTLSGEADADHPLGDALSTAGDAVYWKDGTGPAALTIDLGGSAKPAIIRFNGGGANVFLAGVRIEGASTVNGEWTKLSTIGAEPGWWPETVVHLDERPWAFLRLSGDKGMGVRALQVQVRTPEIPGAVVAFHQSGKPLTKLPDVNAPVGLAYDPTADRLLVFNDDADQQIHAFTHLEGPPRRDATWMNGGRFGVAGGLASAQGVFGPQRFDLVRGLGLDASGNLAVFSVGHTGISQSRLESYAPDGRRMWDMKGLAFLDMAETDPGDTATAWSATIRYRREANGRDGQGWTAVGNTLDHVAYPEDPRLHGLVAQVMGVRRIAGKPFLFLTTQYSDIVAVYRFNANGIAVPCAYFAARPGGSVYPLNAPAGGSWLAWNDHNGDGRFQAEEWRAGANLGLNPFTVDASGGIWFCDPRAKVIRHIPAAPTLDAHGCPRWPLISERAIPFPAVFDDINQAKGLEVAPDGKTIFIFGFNAALPMTSQSNLPVGRMVVRYDLSAAVPRVTHQVAVPYDVALSVGSKPDQIVATSIAGEYLFLGYGRRMDVLVLRTADLSPVGHIEPGSQTQRPIFDGPSELIAAIDGVEYDIFMPQYLGNATTHVRWSPSMTKYLPAPDAFAAKRVGTSSVLTWQATTGVSGWRIEQQKLLSDGWGKWTEIARVKADVHSWAEPSFATACGYRIRAEGDAGVVSDWSVSRWLRE